MSPSKIMAARGRASAVLQRTMGARGAAPMRGGVSPVRGGVPSRGGVPAMARGGLRPGAPSMVRGRGGAVPGGQPVRPRPQTSPQGGAPLQRPSPVATPHLPPGMSVTRTKPGSGGAQPPVSSTSASAPPRPAAPQPQRPATSTVPAPQQWGNSPYSHAAYGSHQVWFDSRRYMFHAKFLFQCTYLLGSIYLGDIKKDMSKWMEITIEGSQYISSIMKGVLFAIEKQKSS